MSYSNPRYSARQTLIAVGTTTGTWPATASAAVGTCTGLTFVLPRMAHPFAIKGAKVYRTGTGGVFTGVKFYIYNGANALGSATGYALAGATDELAHFAFNNQTPEKYPFLTGTALHTATVFVSGTTTASIAATNEILTVAFDVQEVFDNARVN